MSLKLTAKLSNPEMVGVATPVPSIEATSNVSAAAPPPPSLASVTVKVLSTAYPVPALVTATVADPFARTVTVNVAPVPEPCAV